MICRSKSERSTPIPNSAGQSYTDDDLNQAILDIQQGKLNTRKAAEIYKIPRSMLRDKIQMMSSLNKTKQDSEDADMEAVGEIKEVQLSDEDSDVEANASAEARLNAFRNRMLNEGSNGLGDGGDSETDAESNLKRQSPFSSTASQPQASPQATVNAAAALLDPNVLMQTLELVGSLFGINIKEAIAAAAATNAAAAASVVDNNAAAAALNNGKPMFEQRLLLQQLLQSQQQTAVSPFGTNRLPKCETPETASSVDANETSCEDAASSILKIPSYKPVAGAANSRSSVSPQSNAHLSRNGDSPHSIASPRLMIGSAAGSSGNSMQRQAHIISPPLLPQSSTTIRDAFASNIHRLMNEQNALNNNGGLSGLEGKRSDRGYDKKPSISVVKNIGGTDTSHFGAAPNLLVPHNSHAHPHHTSMHSHLHHSQASLSPHSHHHHHLSRQDAAALAAGKGTRPKRGKYRNYDRDSLVEAVKAVQRGEMSVHRAGSYYGVPHSTLEYKVKERHLMRPRKREPKPQPGLDGLSKNSSNIPGGSKSSQLAVNSKHALNASSHKNNNGSAAFPASSAVATGNGMKMPLFDPTASYPGHLLWPHAPNAAAFNQLQMNFNRNAASQPPGASGLEELYDSSAANGSAFFEGIIRQTLGGKTDAKVSAPLLDQLLIDKNPMPFPNHRVNDYAASSCSTGGKRAAGSPLGYAEIKRERSSPMHSSEEDDEAASVSGTDEIMEHNNNNKNNMHRRDNDQLRHSRLASHEADSETDASSLKSERISSGEQAYQHNNNKEDTSSLNGGNSLVADTKAIQIKTELNAVSESSSILQEKLAQIKAEQENGENL